MDMAKLCETVGDVTDYFRGTKNKDVAGLVESGIIRVERQMVDPPSDPIDFFVRRQKVGMLCVFLNDKPVAPRLEMPRDVWNVLRGIAIGMNL